MKPCLIATKHELAKFALYTLLLNASDLLQNNIPALPCDMHFLRFAFHLCHIYFYTGKRDSRNKQTNHWVNVQEHLQTVRDTPTPS